MAHNTKHWEDYMTENRDDWELNNTGHRWDDTEHGYRYGWEAALDERNRNRSYADAEAELQRDWNDYNTKHQRLDIGAQTDNSWENVRHSVRQGWERSKQQFRETI